ncbi:MAG: hypothetical protein ACSHYA_00290 [Opitutaceae bacterium]
MNEEDSYKAFKHIQASISPTEEQINAMTRSEVSHALEDEGYIKEELEAKTNSAKARFSGRYALLLARRRREMKEAIVQEPIDFPADKDSIIKVFEAKYGDEMPMAARNYRNASYEELCLLYQDMMEGDCPDSKASE